MLVREKLKPKRGFVKLVKRTDNLVRFLVFGTSFVLGEQGRFSSLQAVSHWNSYPFHKRPQAFQMGLPMFGDMKKLERVSILADRQ